MFDEDDEIDDEYATQVMYQTVLVHIIDDVDDNDENDEIDEWCKLLLIHCLKNDV